MKIFFLLNLTFLIALCLCSDHKQPPLRKNIPLNSRILSSDTTSGKLPLLRDEHGLYVLANLISTSSDYPVPTSNPRTVPMILSLYSSFTLLTSNCLGFSEYTCSNPTCYPFNWVNTSLALPYFTAEGYKASAVAYLDENNWFLQDYAIIVTSCTSNMAHLYGSSRYGIIGMGYKGDGILNFVNPYTSFSVYIEKDLSSGYVLFDLDDTLVQPNTPQIVLKTDQNLSIIASAMIFSGRQNITFNNIQISFDISSDTNGFPQIIYQEVIVYLSSWMNCSAENYQPVCQYSGSVLDLPNITLHIQNKKVDVPPQVYVQNFFNQTANATSITLNLKVLSSNLAGECYVTPAFDNYIILGSSFISYYYIAFYPSLVHSQVTLSIAGPDPTAQISAKYTWIYILCAGILLALILISFGVYYLKRRKSRRNAKIFPSERALLLEGAIRVSLSE